MSIFICAFEGLGLGTPTHLKRGLLKHVEGREDVSVWRGSFMSRGPFDGRYDKLIVIGHSMGGPTALWYCNMLKKNPVDLLLTLDPRPLHRPYIKPANVKRAVNFYRGKFGVLSMQGYPVEGAENNHRPKWSHTGMPFEREVLDVLMEAIG